MKDNGLTLNEIKDGVQGSKEALEEIRKAIREEFFKLPPCRRKILMDFYGRDHKIIPFHSEDKPI